MMVENNLKKETIKQAKRILEKHQEDYGEEAKRMVKNKQIFW